MPINDFFQLAINCYADSKGRFYKSLAEKISFLIKLFDIETWRDFLSKLMQQIA